jgi:hypothetical protein
MCTLVYGTALSQDYISFIKYFIRKESSGEITEYVQVFARDAFSEEK